MADLRPKHRFVLVRHSPVVSELQRAIVGADLAATRHSDNASHTRAPFAKPSIENTLPVPASKTAFARPGLPHASGFRPMRNAV